jgi:hypothetical protein
VPEDPHGGPEPVDRVWTLPTFDVSPATMCATPSKRPERTRFPNVNVFEENDTPPCTLSGPSSVERVKRCEALPPVPKRVCPSMLDPSTR